MKPCGADVLITGSGVQRRSPDLRENELRARSVARSLHVAEPRDDDSTSYYGSEASRGMQVGKLEGTIPMAVGPRLGD